MIRISAKRFASLAPFVGRSVSRHDLTGIIISPSPDGCGARMVATDGYVLGAWHDPDGKASDSISIRPTPLLLAAIRAGNADSVLECDADGSVNIVSGTSKLATIHDCTFDAPPIDPWMVIERAIKKCADPEPSPSFFDPKVANRFSRLSAVKSAISIATCGGYNSGIVRVADHPDFIGLIMPMRVDTRVDARFAVPSWVMNRVEDQA
jgi:hypothetical protein